MKLKWKNLLLCEAIPLAAGGLSAFLTREGMKDFQFVDQPPLSPPMWVFPIVWTVLFLLMGYASYRVYVSHGPGKGKALTVYGAQLAVNFLWSIFFFNCGWYLFSFLWLVLLWALILWTFRLFHTLDAAAGWLLIPYLVWVTFAGYLTFGVYLLN